MNKSAFWSLWIGVAAIAFGVGRLMGVGSAPADEQAAMAVAAVPANYASETGAAGAAVAVETAAVNEPAAEVETVAKVETPKAKPPAPKVEEAPIAESVSDFDRSGLDFPEENGVLMGEPPGQAKGLPLPKSPGGFVPSPARGADDPLVLVYISSDFQCPVCRRAVLPAEQLIKDLGSEDVRVEFKQHPLSSHARAEDASVAALAAHKQGKFWEFHDLLFGNFGRLTRDDFEEHAETLKLDMAKFRSDLDDPNLRAQAQSEGWAADVQGARGTPGFFINGRKQVGWGSYYGFKGLVTRELDKAKALEAQGKSRAEVRRIRAQENAEKPTDFIKNFLDGVPAEQPG